MFLECLDRTVWKITTGTFSQYNVFIDDPEGLYMLQYEMYNNSPICREFSFNKKEFKQNKLEMSTKLLGGDARFIWNQNEIYCTYKNKLRTENKTFLSWIPKNNKIKFTTWSDNNRMYNTGYNACRLACELYPNEEIYMIGFDIFGKAILKILNKHEKWSSIVVGDEPRDKLDFKHSRLKNFGFKEHKEVIDIYLSLIHI